MSTQTTAEQQTLAQARLLFHVQHPDYDTIWLEGYHSDLNADNAGDNPYPIDSQAYSFWEEGYWAAVYAEEPLFDYAGNSMPNRLKVIADSTRIIRAAQYREQRQVAANQSVFVKVGYATLVSYLAP